MPRVREDLQICSQTIPATCFTLHYGPYNTVPPLICGDKTKKSCQSGEQTWPQEPSTVLSQVTEGQVTFKPPFNTMSWIFKKMAVFAVQVASTEALVTIFQSLLLTYNVFPMCVCVCKCSPLYPVYAGGVQVTLVSACLRVFAVFRSVSWPCL